MPTIPRSKPPVDAYIAPIHITSADVRKLKDLAFDPNEDPDGAIGISLISDVAELLPIAFNMLRRLPARPLPTHVVAALEPIAKKANELATLLHPDKLPMEVCRELGGYDVSGIAWHLLTQISMSATVAIKRLEQQDCTGQHNRRLSEAMASVKTALEQIFDKYAIEPEDGDKAEFLAICLDYYLPKPSSKNK